MRIKIFGITAFMLLTSIASAAPDENSTVLAWFLWNVSLIVTSITTMFTSIMAVFMEPPLIIFVGMGIFGFIIAIIGRYMAGRRK